MFVCVHVLLDRWLQWEEGIDLHSEKCVGKLNNKLFTSFISHACSSLVNTFKSICHPLSHSSRSAHYFVSHLYYWAPSLSVGTSVFRHKTRQDQNITEDQWKHSRLRLPEPMTMQCVWKQSLVWILIRSHSLLLHKYATVAPLLVFCRKVLKVRRHNYL